MPSHVDDFNTRNKVLTAKLLKRRFSKFNRRQFYIVSKYNVGLKTLLLQGLAEPEFYADVVYQFRKIIGLNEFSYHFKQITIRYTKIGYNIDVWRQTAFFLLLIQSSLTALLTSLIARR